MKGLQSVAFVRTHLLLYMRQRPHSPLLVHGFPCITSARARDPSFLGVLLLPAPAPAASVAFATFAFQRCLIFLIFFFLPSACLFLTFFLTVRLGPPVEADKCKVSSDRSVSDARRESKGSPSAVAPLESRGLPSALASPESRGLPASREGMGGLNHSRPWQYSTHSFSRPAVILYTYFVMSTLEWHNKNIVSGISFCLLEFSLLTLPFHIAITCTSLGTKMYCRPPPQPTSPNCLDFLMFA